MSRLIVLTGPMGSGKTTVGRLLASRLGVPMLDSDEQILAAHGADARRVAEERGVQALHRLEAEVFVSSLDSDGPVVIAAAASIADRDDLVKRLAGDDIFAVLLSGDPAVLRERCSGASHRRDLSPTEGEELGHRRAARLRQAVDLTVDVTSITPQQVAERITACSGWAGPP